ncbi:hypothetical protein FF100_04680 [Methylobacterium terricola]|uniref:Uncharacterized protein n=1 Tax=Methylobacterium terricola TaxID=2583531 RepID=A0A5C4LLX6_9HYPH|nr:hypothetical protein [Methylobacterium terricola]TNC14878.1 hypothetical protein FF100_04680 [Methylobacterium terricola]
MPNVLHPHHLDQFAGRHQGVRHNCEQVSIPRLSPADYRRMLGMAPDQVRARQVAKAKTYFSATCLFIVAAAGTVFVQAWL